LDGGQETHQNDEPVEFAKDVLGTCVLQHNPLDFCQHLGRGR
jgi:hypothetical protein